MKKIRSGIRLSSTPSRRFSRRGSGKWRGKGRKSRPFSGDFFSFLTFFFYDMFSPKNKYGKQKQREKGGNLNPSAVTFSLNFFYQFGYFLVPKSQIWETPYSCISMALFMIIFAWPAPWKIIFEFIVFLKSALREGQSAAFGAVNNRAYGDRTGVDGIAKK